jgi:hypothetical protein
MVPKRGKGRNKLWLLLKKRHHRSLGWERRMGDGKVGLVNPIIEKKPELKRDK